MTPRVWSWQLPLTGSKDELARLIRENWRLRVGIERMWRLRFKDALV